MRRPRPAARPLPIGRHAGREEDVAVDRTAHGAEPLRPRVQTRSRALDLRGRRLVDQIELVHDEEVGGLDLRARDLRSPQVPLDVRRVDHGDDRVEPETDVLHPIRERLRVGEARRLDDDQVRLAVSTISWIARSKR